MKWGAQMPGEAQHSVTENTASPLDLSRRDLVATASATAGGFALAPGSAHAATVGTDIANLPPYGNGTLPPGIRSRPIANVNGLTVHILEAGYEVPGRPAVLLLHGFPELAYSWRKVMLPLAAAEYHVIAPDQRGYGRTIGWDDSYDADPDLFCILNMVRDAMGLVFALGYREVAGVVGHDAGSPVAACAEPGASANPPATAEAVATKSRRDRSSGLAVFSVTEFGCASPGIWAPHFTRQTQSAHSRIDYDTDGA